MYLPTFQKIKHETMMNGSIKRAKLGIAATLWRLLISWLFIPKPNLQFDLH